MNSIPKTSWAGDIEWASDVRWDPAAIWLAVVDVQAGTHTSANVILFVLREVTAQINTVALTSMIDLIVKGLGLITDTTIESLTIEYSIEEV